ncbi:MAG: thrombospondin type 3 repeat-containing protein, partial [Acidobacteriota bacterium]
LGGLKDWIRVPDSPSLDINGAITLSAWVNPDLRLGQKILWKVASSDVDLDGIQDLSDGCPQIPDPFQEDADNDGVGTICDNCPLAANADQSNVDGDPWGDACDGDADNDGIPNAIDPAPLMAAGPVLPEEVGNTLLLSGNTALSWDTVAVATSYAVYRTDHNAGTVFSENFVCLQSGLTAPTATDLSVPPPGIIFFYLVTTRSSTGESSPGQTSSGQLRSLAVPCP